MNKVFYDTIGDIMLIKPVSILKSPECIRHKEVYLKEDPQAILKKEFILLTTFNGLWEFMCTDDLHKERLYGFDGLSPVMKTIHFDSEEDITGEKVKTAVKALLDTEKTIVSSMTTEEIIRSGIIKKQFIKHDPEAYSYIFDESILGMSGEEFLAAVSLRHYSNFLRSKEDFNGNRWERHSLSDLAKKTLYRIEEFIDCLCNSCQTVYSGDEQFHYSILHDLAEANMIVKFNRSDFFTLTGKFNLKEFRNFKNKHSIYKDITLPDLFRMGFFVKKDGYPYSNFKSFENSIYERERKKAV